MLVDALQEVLHECLLLGICRQELKLFDARLEFRFARDARL